MSDPYEYDEIKEEAPKRKGSWEYIHCNWVWVPELDETEEDEQ